MGLIVNEATSFPPGWGKLTLEFVGGVVSLLDQKPMDHDRDMKFQFFRIFPSNDK